MFVVVFFALLFVLLFQLVLVRSLVFVLRLSLILSLPILFHSHFLIVAIIEGERREMGGGNYHFYLHFLHFPSLRVLGVYWVCTGCVLGVYWMESWTKGVNSSINTVEAWTLGGGRLGKEQWEESRR